MEFHWVGPNAVDEDGEAGSMGLSPVLKNHNAYLIHNETLYCGQEEEWRGEQDSSGFCCLSATSFVYLLVSPFLSWLVGLLISQTVCW
jgi:hypothetical protein